MAATSRHCGSSPDSWCQDTVGRGFANVHLASSEPSRADIHIVSGNECVTGEDGLQLVRKLHRSQSPDPAWLSLREDRLGAEPLFLLTVQRGC